MEGNDVLGNPCNRYRGRGQRLEIRTNNQSDRRICYRAL